MIQNTVVAPSIWIAFLFLMGLFLLIDLVLFKRFLSNPIFESLVWIFLSLVINGIFAFYYGQSLGVEFLTAYLVEKSLSMDNLFVILLIFQSFKIPLKYQHQVLFLGIIGAIFFRGIFILLGVQLIHHFEWIFYIFGFILIYTAFKFLSQSDEEKEVSQHKVILWFKKILPSTQDFHQGKFWIRRPVLQFTPLFFALITVELTDIVFAIDSIPAVFAITQDSFVAFSSNILAIVGLRALYFVLADWVHTLKYLKPGLSVILGFIGFKMMIFQIYKIPSWVSLLVIFGILTTSALSSWYVARQKS